MKVQSTKSVHFPKFHWGISAGHTRDLPEGKEARETILAHPAIKEVTGKSKTATTKKEVSK